MKYMAALVILLASSLTLADTLDGSKILEQEAVRAQELQRLQHQAEVLKQRAEITRYLEEIKKNGGDVSDLDLGGVSVSLPARDMSPALTMPSSVPAAPKEQVKLPRLLHIEKNRAAFETNEGTLYGSVGTVLPGGYKVVSLSMRDGARLQKNGKQFDIDVAW